MTKKEQEGIYLKRFVELCPELADALVDPSEAPDFVCRILDHSIGIEVVRLFHGAKLGKFAPRAVYSFREQIVDQARQIHTSGEHENVCVEVLFDEVNLTSSKTTAEKLARLVGQELAVRTGDFLVTVEEERELMPEFLQFRVGRGGDLWSVAESQQAPHLSQQIIQAAIDAKGHLVGSYRTKAAEVWLVLVLDRYPLAGSFSVQENSVEAVYIAAFDRVYLLLSMERKNYQLVLRRES